MDHSVALLYVDSIKPQMIDSTGHVGWGIAWYINGLMIPEIHVVRGKTYTFVIEGGNDPGQTAAYHPFYITDDPEGGYQYKSKEQRRKVRVFAGIEESRGWLINILIVLCS